MEAPALRKRKQGTASTIRCRQLLLLMFAIVCGFFCLQPRVAGAEPATSSTSNPRSNRVAVLYPDIGDPYRSIFIAITKGIESGLGSSLRVIPVKDNNLEQVRAQLKSENVGACITLGRTTLDQFEALKLDIPVVRGAVLDPDVPNGGGDSPLGISLTPDPAFLLEQLKRLSPGVSRVTVVYSDARGQALIDRAVAAGKHLNLEVIAHKTEDLIAAAAMYRTIVPRLGPQDALWIPQDPQAIDDRVILPMLLNAAWEQNFILFSSNADHAKRGALYSVYPDNVAMGVNLARIANQRVAGVPVNAGMQPLGDLLMAVNLRTAEHLRLNLNPTLIRSFDLTFPQR